MWNKRRVPPFGRRLGGRRRRSSRWAGPAIVAVLAGLAALSTTGGSTSWQAGGAHVQQIVGRADVESKGVELDLQWAATDRLTLSSTTGFLDAEYEEFIGPCFQGQTVAQGCNLLRDPFGTGRALIGGASGVQDLSGRTTAYAPEWSSVFTAEYVMPLRFGNGLELKTTAKWIYVGGHFVLEDLDPVTFQNAVTRLDASIVLSGGFRDHPWSLAIVGKNLTNEIVFNFANPHSLAGTPITPTFLEPTRVITLRGTFAW